MATNPWVSQEVRSEQNLYEDLVIESLKFYGQDVYYLPREIVTQDNVFLDAIESRFSDAYKIEMYVENTDGFAGEGDLFTKFGIELRDQATFIMARRRWKQLIGDKLDELNFRPREGDVIYVPFSKSLFEITKVETETPFYQLNQLPTFRVTCELFEYSDEDFDTDIDDIDIVENLAYQYKITMRDAAEGRATVETELDDLGQVSIARITEAGFGYKDTPIATVQENPGDNAKFGEGSLNCILGRGIEGDYSQTNVSGTVEMWVYVDELPNINHQQALFLTGGDDNNPLKRWIWGIDNNGYLVYSRYDGLQETSSFTGGNLVFQTSQWHHLLIAAWDTDKIAIYFDGEEKINTTVAGITWDWVSSDRFSFGTSAARTVNGVEWDGFRGYLDDVRVQVGEFATTVTPRLSGSDLVVPTEALTSDSNTALLDNFVPQDASITLTSTNGIVSSSEISSAGLYYLNPPTVTVNLPHTSLNYERGEIVIQDQGGQSIQGEVLKWSDSDQALYLVHVGSSDGTQRQFDNFNAIVGQNSGASWSAEYTEDGDATDEIITGIQESAQNVDVFDDFEGDLGNFLDFSEQNPFGDMS